MLYFNPHLPCGRRLGRRKLPTVNCDISIHTFLAEGDDLWHHGSKWLCQFQSTPSLRKATSVGIMNHMRRKFQSTPSLRKATVNEKALAAGCTNFNPHLPCGRRQNILRNLSIYIIISIHTFLAEGDFSMSSGTSRYIAFQSTPSLRKATLKWKPHSFWRIISIHTFLAEGDTQKIGM